jgi:hypothetical protein
MRIKLAMADAKSKDKTAENDPGVALLQELQKVATEEGEVQQTEEAQPDEGGMGLMSKGA